MLNQNSALEIEYFRTLYVVVTACNNDIAEIAVVQMIETSATASSAQICQ